MLVFLRCDFIPSISFVHIRATRETKKKKKQLVYGYFFHSGAFFASIFPFCFLIPPSFHLCLLPVTVNFHTQSWDDSSNDFYQQKAVQAGTRMISPRALQQGAAYTLSPTRCRPGTVWVQESCCDPSPAVHAS